MVAIPTAIFYDHPDGARSHVRFAFCKQPEVLTEALKRLSQLAERGSGLGLPGSEGASP